MAYGSEKGTGSSDGEIPRAGVPSAGADLEELRREIFLGLMDIERGLVAEWDPDDLKRRVHERLHQTRGG
jgi:hypothetical protein